MHFWKLLTRNKKLHLKNYWFVHQQQKTYSNLYVLCWLSHLSWFQGPKDIPPSFWHRVTNHDVKSKNSKSDFIVFLHNFFMMLKSGGENLKYLWRSYKDFCMYYMWALCLKNSTRSRHSCNFGKILQCWKNLGMFPLSRFWDTIFFNSV